MKCIGLRSELETFFLKCDIEGTLELALVDKPSIKVLVISINLDDGNKHTVDVNNVRKTTS